MNRLLSVCLICVTIATFLAGCSTIPKTNTLTQVSTIDALLAGVYDGHMSCKELVEHGDFGIGTFSGLDGEMILLGGDLYQIRSDGKVYKPDLRITTPFAAVVQFKPDMNFQGSTGMTFHDLERIIDEKAPNKNVFCGIKVKGTFSKMTTRSVPKQKRPYPPLVEVTKDQPVFHIENISGTIVGFRCPPYVKGINVPGYHLHFLSDDLRSGGHILEFTAVKTGIEVDICNKFFLVLPEKEGDFGRADLRRDRSMELESVEK